MRFFSPDDIHINKKNFTSLLDYIKEEKHLYIVDRTNTEMKKVYGDYSEISVPEYLTERSRLLNLSKEDLCKSSEFGISLFEVARAELLSLFVTKFDFESESFGENESLFSIIYDKDFEALINNLAAAAFWLKYWKSFFSTNKFDVALVFSGSLIYSRTAIELLKLHPVRVFVLETFMTGNDFYLEERYSPLSCGQNIGNKNFYEQISYAESPDSYMKALNKFLMSNNLNVKQPEAKHEILFDNNKTVLIIGQVVNDFSLLEKNTYSIKLYESLIENILDQTDYNVIFKSHPWENEKANLKTPFTLDKLKGKFDSNSRVIFVDDYNIKELFAQSKHVVVINSQSGIDAIWNGIKPITLRRPFYSSKGFTVDLNSSEEVVRYIIENPDSTISIEEFNLFEIFLQKILISYLVSKFPSGKIRIREIMNFHKYIPIYKRVAPKPAVLKTQESTKKKLVTVETKKPEIDESKAITTLKRQKLLNKAKNQPVRYMLDSKITMLRCIGKTLHMIGFK